MTEPRDPEWGRPWAALFARLTLGLIFFMAGLWKVFDLGPVGHARRFFIDPYLDSFLPAWSRWGVGTVIPFVELVAGALVLIGLWRGPAYVALGFVLAIVTFGHLHGEPLYAFHQHVFPRLALLLFLLWIPRTVDRFSLDAGLASRRGGRARSGTAP